MGVPWYSGRDRTSRPNRVFVGAAVLTGVLAAVPGRAQDCPFYEPMTIPTVDVRRNSRVYGTSTPPLQSAYVEIRGDIVPTRRQVVLVGWASTISRDAR